jgi:hypothetical protein
MATLTVHFIVNGTVPALGYKVAYKKTTDSSYSFLSTNIFASPAVITGIDPTAQYDGYIQVDCAGVTGAKTTFTTSGQLTPPTPGVPGYNLTLTDGNGYSITTANEGSIILAKLVTENVSYGTQVPYTVTGLQIADLGAGSAPLAGSFVIENTGHSDTKSFAIAADLTTEGTETFTITLDGLTVTQSCTIVDTSLSGGTQPTPVPTCILVEDGWLLDSQQECSGTNPSTIYSRITNRVRVTIKDQNGINTTRSSSTDVVLRFTYNQCWGGVDPVYTQTITIPAGQPSAYLDYTKYDVVDCGQSNCVPEDITFNCAVSNTAGLAFCPTTPTC